MLSRRSVITAGLGLAAAWSMAAITPAFASAVRVVTLGGDLTEIAFALGAGDAIVGRDSSSIYPEAALRIPDVGYLRQLGAEGILSLRPEIILASGSAGPEVVLKQIASTGVRLVQAPEIYDPQTVLLKIKLVAEALAVPGKGQALAADVSGRLARAEVAIKGMAGTPTVLFVLNARDGAPMAAGTGTAADAIIRLAGGRNVFDAHAGYKPISLEAAAAAQPQAIVMMEHTLAALGGIEGVRAHPALRHTPAALQRRIIARNAVYLLSFGPRLPEAMLDLAQSLRQNST